MCASPPCGFFIMKFTDQEIARFQSRFTSGELDKCWEWSACKTRAGYGVIRFSKKDVYAHRLSYFLAHPEWDWSLFVCHRCDNPGCVNPSHLFLGTAKDNYDDMERKGRHGGRFDQRKQDNSGEKHGMSKLNEAAVREIRRLYNGGMASTAIAVQFGIKHVCAWNAATGKSWKHNPSWLPEALRGVLRHAVGRSVFAERLFHVPFRGHSARIGNGLLPARGRMEAFVRIGVFLFVFHN